MSTTPVAPDPAQGGGASSLVPPLLGTVLDWSLILTLVFGGCCSNAWSLGRLLQANRDVGSAITFAQLIFVALRQLPSFLTLHPITLPGTSTKLPLLPVLKPRTVPIRRWVVDVLLITAVSVLNNRVFGYRIPLTVQIIFRSGGLAVSMLLGYLRLGRKYSFLQVFSVLTVTIGIILATLSSRPPSSSPSIPAPSIPDATPDKSSGTASTTAVAPGDYAMGVMLLLVGLLLSGVLGLRQEETFRVWGPQWQESLFYTHLLSLPLWSLFLPQIRSGIQSIHSSSQTDQTTLPISLYLPPRTPLSPRWTVRVPTLWWALGLNVVSQYACVGGVNRLTTRVSSVAVNLILTARKTLSVIINVLYLGEGWNMGLVVGAGMVAVGTVLYGMAPGAPGAGKAMTKAEEKRANGVKEE